jgi:transcription antitermination factor NusG
MSIAMPDQLQHQTLSALPAAYAEPRWYAAYTRAQHEKHIAQRLELGRVESYLPLYEKQSRWKDRRVRLQLPLFPGYVFVRIALKERLAVLRIPGVVRLVSFNNLPAPLPEGQIEALRRVLGNGLRAEPCPFLNSGRRVRVRFGPLAGFEGILVRRKANYRFVVSVDLIMRSMMVDIDGTDLEPIGESIECRPNELGPSAGVF